MSATEVGVELAEAAFSARRADAATLAALLSDARQQTLATFAAYEAALGSSDLAVPYSGQLNPPRWELGHIGWFQEWWLRRFDDRARGAAADPDAARRPPRRAGADAWFDSSRVPHRERWRLPLPSADQLRDELARGLEDTLALLADAAQDDDTLYFFRLALFHEDMHHEAAVYMAQHLGIALPARGPRAHAGTVALRCGGATHEAGAGGAGFDFDNELGRHAVWLAPFEIDSAPVSWRQFLAFVDDGGYGQRPCWSEPGWRWRQALPDALPRYLRRIDGGFERLDFGRWSAIDPGLPAMNLTLFEAEAYCRWAGRRLPSEAEWEHAALCAPGFEWGQVWEWTASTFAPYPGFRAHPYRDYSAPWFGSRPVLRGGSFATTPRMKHPRYRNFFTAERNDLHAGFRTCALDR